MSNPQFQELLNESTPVGQIIEKSSQERSELLTLETVSTKKPTSFVEQVKNQLNSLEK
jgi:hypothetical protein